MADASEINQPIYQKSPAGVAEALRQGEILSHLIQWRLDPASLPKAGEQAEIKALEHIHPWALVLSQSCDLAQDFNLRRPEMQGAAKQIPSILFAEVVTAQDLKRLISGSDFWKRISQNNDPRYQFLQKVSADHDALGEGLPELGLDFKRFFTIPTGEVYRRIELGECQRRCCLVSPYLEHLSQRLGAFLGRVGLPSDHFSERD